MGGFGGKESVGVWRRRGVRNEYRRRQLDYSLSTHRTQRHFKPTNRTSGRISSRLSGASSEQQTFFFFLPSAYEHFTPPLSPNSSPFIHSLLLLVFPPSPTDLIAIGMQDVSIFMRLSLAVCIFTTSPRLPAFSNRSHRHRNAVCE